MNGGERSATKRVRRRLIHKLPWSRTTQSAHYSFAESCIAKMRLSLPSRMSRRSNDIPSLRATACEGTLSRSIMENQAWPLQHFPGVVADTGAGFSGEATIPKISSRMPTHLKLVLCRIADTLPGQPAIPDDLVTLLQDERPETISVLFVVTEVPVDPMPSSAHR